MIKMILLAMLFVANAVLGVAYAAIDINKADKAGLESVSGIGPATADRILTERKKGEFKDWADVENRVKGIKGAKAGKLSQAGLTVNGAAKEGADSSAVKKTSTKPEDKMSANKK